MLGERHVARWQIDVDLVKDSEDRYDRFQVALLGILGVAVLLLALSGPTLACVGTLGLLLELAVLVGLGRFDRTGEMLVDEAGLRVRIGARQRCVPWSEVHGVELTSSVVWPLEVVQITHAAGRLSLRLTLDKAIQLAVVAGRCAGIVAPRMTIEREVDWSSASWELRRAGDPEPWLRVEAGVEGVVVKRPMVELRTVVRWDELEARRDDLGCLVIAGARTRERIAVPLAVADEILRVVDQHLRQHTARRATAVDLEEQRRLAQLKARGAGS